jgi:hypothetical protein
MDTVLYTGTGAELVITDLNFSPDLVWTKGRTVESNNALQDAVRGFTTNRKLSSNRTDEEDGAAVDDQYGYISAVGPFGYTISKDGTGGDDWLQMNQNGEDYVAWNWKKDPKFGFDIVGYEGTGVARTVPHSLGVVPEMMIVKNRDSAEGWAVYHKYLDITPEDYFIALDTSAAKIDSSAIWNDTSPTASLFTVGIGAKVNTNNDDHIAYLFASIPGFSKVFSYTGNNLDDGPFVYCGFRPRYIFVKPATRPGNWLIYDTARDTYNELDTILVVDTSIAETTFSGFDFLSNGFKVRNLTTAINGDGDTYIGIAFAEHPFKYSNAR